MIKKFIWVPCTLIVATALLGCQSTTKGAQVKKPMKKEPAMKSGSLRPKIIIRRSFNDPPPPEAKDAQSMPNEKDPQDLPNVKLDEPVVITLMPYSTQKKPTVKGTPGQTNH